MFKLSSPSNYDLSPYLNVLAGLFKELPIHRPFTTSQGTVFWHMPQLSYWNCSHHCSHLQWLKSQFHGLYFTLHPTLHSNSLLSPIVLSSLASSRSLLVDLLLLLPLGHYIPVSLHGVYSSTQSFVIKCLFEYKIICAPMI